jgi:hypothetical protein
MLVANRLGLFGRGPVHNLTHGTATLSSKKPARLRRRAHVSSCHFISDYSHLSAKSSGLRCVQVFELPFHWCLRANSRKEKLQKM